MIWCSSLLAHALLWRPIKNPHTQNILRKQDIVSLSLSISPALWSIIGICVCMTTSKLAQKRDSECRRICSCPKLLSEKHENQLYWHWIMTKHSTFFQHEKLCRLYENRINWQGTRTEYPSKFPCVFEKWQEFTWASVAGMIWSSRFDVSWSFK